MSELRFQDLASDLSLVWVISTGRPLDGCQQRVLEGGLCPWAGDPSLQSRCPTFHQAGSWQLTLQYPGPCLARCPPGRGLAPGSWPGPDQRACSARQGLHFASVPPSPAHPASASSSLLLIWFLSRMITFSNNKTRVHFLTADFSHALIQRYRSPCPVLV